MTLLLLLQSLVLCILFELFIRRRRTTTLSMGGGQRHLLPHGRGYSTSQCPDQRRVSGDRGGSSLTKASAITFRARHSQTVNDGTHSEWSVQGRLHEVSVASAQRQDLMDMCILSSHDSLTYDLSQKLSLDTTFYPRRSPGWGTHSYPRRPKATCSSSHPHGAVCE